VSHPSFRRALSGLCSLALIAGTAHADPVVFGPNDVQTLFYIAKSNNHDRVDYGIRLDASCRPATAEAVFPYWRDLERTPVSVHTMGTLAMMAYGVAAQRLERKKSGAVVDWIALKPVSRPIWVTTAKAEDGHCKAIARTKIGAVEHAELLSMYVKLAGPVSVDYVDIKGRNPVTGEMLSERIKR
jgi:hypothetical protein